MNRRDFFRLSASILAAPLLAYLPATTEAAPDTGFISIDAVRRAKDLLEANQAADSYVVFVHPDVTRDITHFMARHKWKHAHRQARLEIKNMARLVNGQIGRIDQIRFIRTDLLK